jgi:protein phosphatase PTC2/3
MKSQLARALLVARRTGSSTIPTVIDPASNVYIAYGAPTNWPFGVAEAVLKRRLVVKYVPTSELGGWDLPSASAANSTFNLDIEDDFSAAELDPLPSVRFFTGMDRGTVPYQEDMVIAVPEFHDANRASPSCVHSLFAVVDGNGGASAALFVHKHLSKTLARNRHFRNNVDLALREAFLRLDRDLLLDAERRGLDESGAATVVALRRGRRVWVAHAGDCKAVLCRGGAAIELTRDHRAEVSPEEVRRVAREGGYITGGRLMGEVSILRGFGCLRREGGMKLRGLSPEPDIVSFDVGGGDEFLLLGSDGLFDVFPPPQVVRMLLMRSENLKLGVDEICERAGMEGCDNVSAVVVQFKELEVPKRSPLLLRKRK